MTNPTPRSNRLPLLLAALITVAALALRYALRDATNGDIFTFFEPWYDYIVAHGGWPALGDAFANYTPPYTYLLTLVTYLPFPTKTLAIKSIGMLFDLVAAVTMFWLARRRYPAGPAPWLAYAAVLFAPTVVVNSSYWGQSDVIYSSGLLLFVYLTLRDRPAAAWTVLGIAFSFKLQTLFIGPLLAVLLWRRRQAWYLPGLVPLVYVLAVLPAALFGRPLWDLLTIYLSQGTQYPDIWKGAANFYMFVPNQFFEVAVWAGLALAALGALGLFFLVVRSAAPLNDERLLLLATFSVTLMPFLLPKMHERYFFAADLFTIALAFYRPRLWFLPLLMQLASISAYGPFMWGDSLLPLRLLPFITLAVLGVLGRELLIELYPETGRWLLARIRQTTTSP